MRSVYRTVHMGDFGHEEAKRNILLSKRKAHDIEKGYKKRGVSRKEAERRAWATVNKSDRGGRKKEKEVAGKSEVNQVPAKMEEKVVEGRAAQSTS